MAIRISLFVPAAVLACTIGSAASAQLSGLSTSIPQSLASVLVGNGVQQSAPIVSVPGGAQPLIGIGALSGGPDHYGSLLTISALNTGRLLGVDGPGGLASTTQVSIPNPRAAPVLSGIK